MKSLLLGLALVMSANVFAIDDYPYLNDYLLLPKLETEFTFQDHNRSCAVCVRFTQGRVTTRALEILQAHVTGSVRNFSGDKHGPSTAGKVVEDGVEFETPCPTYMYIFQLKTDGMMFSDLAKFVFEGQYDGGQLGVTRGSCSEPKQK